MDLSDLIDRNAAFAPDKAAIRFAGRTLTYAGFAQRIAQAARALKSQWGVGPGDRVAVLAFNHPDTLVLLYACARLGAMLVPVNWRLAVPEQLYILGRCVGEGAGGRAGVCRYCRAVAAGRSRRCMSPDWTLHRTAGRHSTRCLQGGSGDGRAASADFTVAAAHRLHLRHHRPAQGRGAAPGRAAGQRGDEPAPARHDRRRPCADGAADLPCRRPQHPDHAGAATGRDRDAARALCAGADA